MKSGRAVNGVLISIGLGSRFGLSENQVDVCGIQKQESPDRTTGIGRKRNDCSRAPSAVSSHWQVSPRIAEGALVGVELVEGRRTRLRNWR